MTHSPNNLTHRIIILRRNLLLEISFCVLQLMQGRLIATINIAMVGQVRVRSPAMNLQMLGDAFASLHEVHGNGLIDGVLSHQSIAGPLSTCYGNQIVS